MRIDEVKQLLRDKYPELHSPTGRISMKRVLQPKVDILRREQVALVSDGYIEMTSTFAGVNNPAEFHCNSCGWDWTVVYQKTGEGRRGCPVCGGSNPLTNELFDFRLRLHHGGTIQRRGTYVNMHTGVLCECTECNHQWEPLPTHIAPPENTASYIAGCPNCAKQVPNVLYMWDYKVGNTIVTKVGVSITSSPYMNRARRVAKEHEVDILSYSQVICDDSKELESFIKESLVEYRAPYSTIKEKEGHTEMFILPVHVKEQLGRLINDSI